MKTTISLPDALFDMAERIARQLQVSRSELYREALEEFVRTRHAWVVRERLGDDTIKEAASPDSATLDDDLARRAGELTGVTDRTTLMRLALEALIARESARRLADLGGTQKHLDPVPRRRSDT